MDIEAAMFEKYGSRADFNPAGMGAIKEEEEITREKERLEINQASEGSMDAQ